MKKEYLKPIIGYFSEIKNEKLLKKIIEKYEDDNAPYEEACLVMKNDFEGKSTGDVFAVLDYENSFTIIDLYGNVETYYKDNFLERYVDVCEIACYFEDYFEYCGYDDPRFYKLFVPLWVDICSTINRYGLNKEKFLSCFKQNNCDVAYNIVQEYYDCLKTNSVREFIKDYYIYKLHFSKTNSVREFVKYYNL